jgi:hypothetical protein
VRDLRQRHIVLGAAAFRIQPQVELVLSAEFEERTKSRGGAMRGRMIEVEYASHAYSDLLVYAL